MQAAIDRMNVAAAALIEADIDAPMLLGISGSPFEMADILEGMVRTHRIRT